MSEQPIAENGLPPCEVHVPGRDAPSPWCAACRMSGATAENDAPSQRGFLDATTGRQPHRCDLPKPFDIVFDGGPSGIFANGKPRLVLPGPVGSRWHCGGCPAVYVLTYHRGAPGQGSGYEWDLETRRQCRERLGLRWWQRREGVTR